MKKVTFTSIVLLVAQVALGQQQSTGLSHQIPPGVRTQVDQLLERAHVREEEGAELRRQKRYAASEAAYEAAIEILKPSPLFQSGPKSGLAETYMAEGLYDLAVKTYKPLYQPNSSNVEIMCGLAISYARTNRSEEGAMLTVKLAEMWRQQFLRKEDLPLSVAVNSANVEASALALWTVLQTDEKHPKEMVDRLERASALAPHNAGIQFYNAQVRERLLKAKWSLVEEDYKQAYRYGSEEMRRILRITFAENGAKVPMLGNK